MAGTTTEPPPPCATCGAEYERKPGYDVPGFDKTVWRRGCECHKLPPEEEQPEPEKRACRECGVEHTPTWTPGVWRDKDFRWFPAGRWYYRVNCDCDAKRQAEEVKRVRAQQRQEQIDHLFASCRLAPRFRERTFESFCPVAGTEKALAVCRGFVESYADRKAEGQGVLLIGGNGVGKTHLAAAMVNELVPKLIPCLFTSVAEYLDRLRQEYRKEHGDADRIEEQTAAIDVLVLDDLGSEKLASGEQGDWARERIYLLVNRRYEWLRPTVITVNVSEQALVERLGNRAVSRIYGMCKVAKFAASVPDYRRRKV